MTLRTRRIITTLITLVGFALVMLAAAPPVVEELRTQEPIPAPSAVSTGDASTALTELPVKGKAPKTGYSRDQFGSGWSSVNGCDTRQIILFRDLTNTVLEDECKVVSGELLDPYTNKIISFSGGADVQIDHVVALSNAWQTGAQALSREDRVLLANDPLELIAVDGPANQQKGDGDAATWLPDNKSFRCEYVARQVAVKKKYSLWVTVSEKEAIQRVLSACPSQALPVK